MIIYHKITITVFLTIYIFDLFFAGFASSQGQGAIVYIYSIELHPYLYFSLTIPLIIGFLFFKQKLSYIFQTSILIISILLLDFIKFKYYKDYHPFDPYNKLNELIYDDKIYANSYEEYMNLPREKKEKVTIIKLNKLDHFPKFLYSFPNLKELNLSDNKFQSIDCNSLQNLNQLETLLLYDNEISEIPECINSLPKLRILTLSRNKLRTIDKSILKNNTIEELYLAENNLRIKIKDQPMFKNMISIDLSNNYIDEIPLTWNSLKKLKTFTLRNNKFHKIPKNLELLENLEYIWLENNHIEYFPENLLKLKNLKRIDLSDNKIKYLPQSLCGEFIYPNGKPVIYLANNPIYKKNLKKIVECNRSFSIYPISID